ncbi:type I-U CRISPR-associated protein Csb2 [Verrucomicrobium sp. BvORR106]|uniref:type I-G CRISPR-associated protein Csb2 n=1 Tax=Verrucomicrobium sp. BvORR106 TaxID=1403819 RepID=UPI00056DAA62|nr:type I-U CRISPR-associated protein Csb2 [Verrucomicrobium sp. BvORR106]
MAEYFRISIHFLGGEFHGRSDNGESEWPPSPLRLFQALTNAAARLDGSGIAEQNAAALRWFEALTQPPEIFADKATPTTGCQFYVPDNVGDLVAKQWSDGKYFDSKNHPIDIAGFRTEKRVRPLVLRGSCAVHYIWKLGESSSIASIRETIAVIAKATSRLGWGVDLVVVDAAFEESTHIDSSLERWLPVETSGGSPLRVPVSGTFAALEERHTAFLSRLQTTGDGKQFFSPVPPLEQFRVVTYRRETEIARPPYAILALRNLDDRTYASFDAQWRRLHLAGMLRHTASQSDFAAALGWDKKRVDSFVLGHDKGGSTNSDVPQDSARLVFVPLPSIEWRGEERGFTTGAIRRVLVTVQGFCPNSEFSRIVRVLEGRELIDEKSKLPAAFLRRQSEKDRAVDSYFSKESAVWATVTPVVLPGHDDPRQLRKRLRPEAPALSAEEKAQILRKLDVRIERLLRKALLDSGLPAPLVANAELQWRDTGFVQGVDLASRYSVPDHCRRFRRLHVRICWREHILEGSAQPIKLKGPFCIGSGKFAGLGLFVPLEG